MSSKVNMTRTAGSPLRFEKAGYYFLALIALILLGFWPSYFSRFLDGTADFNAYFHFHAAIATLWVFMLIAQPILIRQKQRQLHRIIGRLSYVLIPLLFLSVILLAHSRITGNEEDLALSLWIPFKDLFIIGISYSIAIAYRATPDIHARGMIAAGLALIEPALSRVIQNNFFPGPDFMPAGFLVMIGIIYSIIITLMIMERRQRRGRWVFPLILFLMIFVHAVIYFQIRIAPWKVFAEWFAKLPLT